MLHTNRVWPCWRDSIRHNHKFTPLPKKAAVRLFHKARRFERQTRRPGYQDGAIGRNGILLLHALLFDCLNYASGRLDPSYAKLAEKACISRRSVARGLANLRAAGVLTWVRRCREGEDELGRFRLEQETNAYGVLPPVLWRGFYERPEPPLPHPTAWGATPPLDLFAEARAEPGERARLAILRSGGGSAAAVANYWSASMAMNREPRS